MKAGIFLIMKMSKKEILNLEVGSYEYNKCLENIKKCEKIIYGKNKSY